ncbi:MAG: M20/M25/M40 family metallo-hydrolase [Gemmatimonadaceae bacterium]|nr:M20/M25/M40 family metallo-hydrolase [Gemmatimonadaceae bacterium]
MSALSLVRRACPRREVVAAAALAALSPAIAFRPLAAQELSGRAARDAARSYREANEAGILREFAGLLSLPNVASDSVNIRRNAALLMEMLRKRGATARLLEVPGGPPAVLGELTVPGATRTVVLYAHYDGQPVDPKQWTGGTPFTPILRDKALYQGGKEIAFPNDGQRLDGEARIYARSASDDKGSIIAMLTALDALKARGAAPSLNLKFFFEGEEEAGSGHLQQILETYKSVLKGDAWLFCDGPVHQGGDQQLVFGLRGVTGLEMTVYGPTRPLHSGHYGNWAPNPGMLLTHLVASMRSDDGEILIPGFYRDVRPLSAAERKAIAGLPLVDTTLRRSLGLARTEGSNALLAERIMRPALNLRGIRVGGVQELGSNTISTEAFASFDFRLVPNQTPERVRELVERHLRTKGWHIVSDTPSVADRLKYPRLVRLQWEKGYPAQRASMDDPFSQALVRAVSDGAPKAPLLVPTLGGSGPSYLFTLVLGVPVVTLPIANYDNNQHATNENLRVQNLWNAIEMYAGMMSRLGREWGGPVVP